MSYITSADRWNQSIHPSVLSVYKNTINKTKKAKNPKNNTDLNCRFMILNFRFTHKPPLQKREES